MMLPVPLRITVLCVCLFLTATFAHAVPISLTATGEYIMGDNDTFTEGKRLALEDAKRLVLEKVGTYIESTTQVKDYVVKSEEIRLYTAGIVKVNEVREERRIVDNKAMVIVITVKAFVDPDVVVKQIAHMRSSKKIEEKSRRYSEENIRLRREIDRLNSQLRSAVNEGRFREFRRQREVYLDKIQENERGLTILLSEGSLFQAALQNRKKKQDDLQIIRTFLKEVAAAYTITYSDPEIEDNGNGSANVRIPVSVRLPGSFAVGRSRIDVASMETFSQTGLIIRGYPDGGLSFACSDKINAKECAHSLKPFIDQETKSFRINVLFGRYSVTDNLTFQSVLDPSPKRGTIKEYRVISKRGRQVVKVPIKASSIPAAADTPSSIHVSPLSHAKNFTFDFDSIPLAVLKSINRIDIKVSY